MADIPHNKKHDINSATDHGSSIIEGNVIEADANGLPADSGVDSADLDTLTGGDASNADALHSHCCLDQLCKGGEDGMPAGAVVYYSGQSGNEPVIKLAKADSDDTMPAAGITLESGDTNDDIRIRTYGVLNSTDTSGESLDDPEMYVSADTAGEWTTTKPIGATNKIQKIATIIDIGANGNIEVSGAGRVNDIPNMANEKAWVGDASGVPQETTFDSANEHLLIEYVGGGSPSMLYTSISSICYNPVGIEFGNTTQQYDVTGATWVSAVSGGTLGGIPDEGSPGHTLSDCLTSIATALDATYLNVRELTGAASATNPLTVQFLFTNMAAFDTLDFRAQYSGSISHVMAIELWNYTTSSWTRLETFSDQADFVTHSLKILGSTNFIGTGGDAGKTILQLIHLTSGVGSHSLAFDYVSLCDGGGGGGPAADHGSLTGLSADDHTQYSLLSSQSGVPTSTPARVGQINVDTTNDRVFISKDTSSAADWVLVNNRFIVWRILDKNTSHVEDTNIGGDLRLPLAYKIKNVWAYVDTAGTGSVTTIDINEADTTVLSTKITIDATEDHSKDAATPPVISDSSIAAWAKVTADMDGIASGDAGIGLTIVFEIDFTG